MKELKEHIKLKKFSKCYLFYGEEAFLKKTYEKRIKEAIIEPDAEAMNYDYFEGKSAEVRKIIDSSETMPFLSENRLVFIKDSGLFQTGKSDEVEKLIEYLKNIPDSTVILFSEESIDKRSKLFKAVSSTGKAVEFKTPEEKELVSWIVKDLKTNGISADNGTAIYFIRTVGADMEVINSELKKLAGYKDFKGVLENKDVDDVCVKSLETKIFDLVGAIGNKKPETALLIYRNLIMMKESPLMVLAMIARQFRLILQCKSLSAEGKQNSEIAQIVGIRDFVARECLSQSRNFSLETLKNALKGCLETDVDIKSGRIGQELGVETLIISYSKK